MIFHSYLYERPETLIKTNSIADFKNMYEAYYKDTRITLIEVVLVVPFWRWIEYDLACWDIFRNNQLEKFSKITMKTLRSFQRNTRRIAEFIVKTWNVMKRDSQISYSSEIVVHRRFQNKCFKKFRKIHKKLQNPSLFWPSAWNFFKKETTTQMFCCDFCSFLEHPFYRAPTDGYFWLVRFLLQNIFTYYTKAIKMTSIEAILVTLMPSRWVCFCLLRKLSSRINSQNLGNF